MTAQFLRSKVRVCTLQVRAMCIHRDPVSYHTYIHARRDSMHHISTNCLIMKGKDGGRGTDEHIIHYTDSSCVSLWFNYFHLTFYVFNYKRKNVSFALWHSGFVVKGWNQNLTKKSSKEDLLLAGKPKRITFETTSPQTRITFSNWCR